MSRPFRKIFPLQTAFSNTAAEPGPVMVTTGFLDPIADYGPWTALDIEQVALILTLYGFGAVAEPPLSPTAWVEVNGLGVVQFEPIQTAGPGSLAPGAQAPAGGSTTAGWSEFYAVVPLASSVRMIASDSVQLRVVATIQEASGNVSMVLVSPTDADAQGVGNLYRGSSLALSGTVPDE